MFTVRLAIGTAGAFALALASVGCIGNKNPDVAADAPAPPPAAYPDTSSSLAGGGAGPVPSTGAAPIPSAATVAGSSAPSTPAPAPFSLREGEQLVAHQIQSGETLSVIAAKYNSSISRIQAANGMKDTKIYAGKTLQIPTSAASTNLAQTAPAAGLGGYAGTVAPAYAAPAPAVTSGYPSTASAPSAPSYPSAPSADGIAAPSVPQAGGYPSTTSYPRADAPAAPSFEASRIQFSN